MGELKELALHPEVGDEGECEHNGVRGQVAARVIANQQDRPVVGDVVEATDLGPMPQGRQEPGGREPLSDEIGVPLVQVGPRDTIENGSGERGTDPLNRARHRPASQCLRADLAVGRSGPWEGLHVRRQMSPARRCCGLCRRGPCEVLEGHRRRGLVAGMVPGA